MKKIATNKQIIIGNNLKAEASIPIGMTYEGGAYEITNRADHERKDIQDIMQHYKAVCVKREEVYDRKIVIDKKTKKKRLVLSKHKVILNHVNSKKDKHIRNTVYGLMMARDSFRYTTYLVNNYMKENYRNMFVKDTPIIRQYEFIIRSTIGRKTRRSLKRATFMYKGITIQESLKTFLLTSEVERWYNRKPFMSDTSTNERYYPTNDEHATILKDQALQELEEFFKKDNPTGMEWEEYADKEVKRLWAVTSDYKMPISKMQK